MHGNGTQQQAPPLSSLDKEFGGQAAPKHPFPPDLKTVPDGEYDCRIDSAEMAVANGAHVVRVGLALLNAGGRVVQHTYWLNRQNAVNTFLAEMLALGFPAQSWGNGPAQEPLSRAIPRCVQRLPGVRFRAVKSSRTVPAKPAWGGQPAREEETYHELFVSGLIGAGNPAIHGQQAAEPAYAGGGGDDNDIPF